MNWYLNQYLTTWRGAVNAEYPDRARTSDGSIGDTKHAESYSEHNPDRDGSVDAWDMDVNLLKSRTPTGTKAELAAVEKLKAEFQRQPGAQLWIHNGVIANKDIGKWRRRKYSGANAHTYHVHWQSDPDFEKRKFTGDLDDDAVIVALNDDARLTVPKVIPNWPKGAPDRGFRESDRSYTTVWRAQTRLKERGWRITRDGVYGPQSVRIVMLFQREKRIKVDGVLGPVTWRTMWTARITA